MRIYILTVPELEFWVRYDSLCFHLPHLVSKFSLSFFSSSIKFANKVFRATNGRYRFYEPILSSQIRLVEEFSAFMLLKIGLALV